MVVVLVRYQFCDCKITTIFAYMQIFCEKNYIFASKCLILRHGLMSGASREQVEGNTYLTMFYLSHKKQPP